MNFIDLFAGIGGFRLSLESLGAKCVFSSEIDISARETYFKNFGEYPEGDITKISSKSIPSHDILCAGFPCQPFSIGGYRKGFSDTRGTLFFDIERIIKAKKPKVIFLENVRGLTNHDKGRTFKIIKNKLNLLGYNIFYKVLNSKDYGVPQNRERIYIIGFRNKKKKFDFDLIKKSKSSLLSLLDQSNKLNQSELSDIALKHVTKHLKKIKKTKKINYQYPQVITEIRPTRCSFRNDNISPCLTAKMGTGGNNVPYLIDYNRFMSVNECLRIQGYPKNFKIYGSKQNKYKQIGNSVSIPLIKKISKLILSE